MYVCMYVIMHACIYVCRYLKASKLNWIKRRGNIQIWRVLFSSSSRQNKKLNKDIKYRISKKFEKLPNEQISMFLTTQKEEKQSWGSIKLLDVIKEKQPCHRSWRSIGVHVQRPIGPIDACLERRHHGILHSNYQTQKRKTSKIHMRKAPDSL